jgi:hypothetical protein
MIVGDRLDTEVRKVLHEVSRIAEEALVRARKLKEEGQPAVEAELGRLDHLEKEVVRARRNDRHSRLRRTCSAVCRHAYG